eukprot:CAMPEP_0184337646 /NCGR_PEP_ID=MMETSP1089-20130417/6064_1 /TAXON_ID=38269 ORGANISM="Gloeochaete wittrockiana, Strain SAG46.84" /NCGR_SAMPLE_ID=MMETSP1089 /ASSEMBLY_ACC=CAM_ASM_000445 /LENGTH=115 /DNA_ID=CAMNT_0026663543 /DNA_START=48 /DNA_END=395 /DNA_ORIENTATION=-
MSSRALLNFIKPFEPTLAKLVAPFHNTVVGYRRYGLLGDDLINETPIVAEAIRRLPGHELELRNRRIKIASDLSVKHIELPENEWTKAEEDRAYLSPIIEEVEQEWRDRKAFRLH